MAYKKYKKYKPKKFESTQNPSDTSANIYMSMLMSPNWMALTKNAQVLYVYCKAQYYAEKRKPELNPLNPRKLTEDEKSRCFTMNMSKWNDLYHIYNKNQNQFQKDMRQLIEYGFVELIEDGSTTRTKSIYMLSDKWWNNTNQPIQE